MKRVLGMLVLASLMITASSAFAADWSSYFDNAAEGFYMGITTAENVAAVPGQVTIDINSDVIPWLHIHKDADSQVNFHSLWWKPTSSKPMFDGYFTDFDNDNGSQDVWIELSDWNNRKEVGLWKVQGYAYDGETTWDMVNFKVAPEPVSAGLFLLGGLGLLGGRAVRRRKA